MNFIDKMMEQFIKMNRRMKRWQRVVSVLSAIVVFATTYALVLPAITLDVEAASTQAGIEIAASENESESGGTVYDAATDEELEEAEQKLENETEDMSVDEDSSSQSGSEDAELSEDEKDEEPAGNPDVTEEEKEEDNETAADALTLEEESEYAATESVDFITEDTQLIYESEDYIIYADFGESAKFPIGVELRVKEITEESDPDVYAIYYEKALSEMQDKYDESTALSFARFYDITFVYDDAEIEPSGNVNMRIEYKKAVDIKESTTVDTIHFDKNDDEKVEVIDSDTEGSQEKVEAVEFESNQFSVYGIVGTEKYSGGVLTAVGETYEITVTYTGNAQIPADAELQVTEITSAEEDYGAYLQQVANMFGIVEDSEEILSGRVFDMKLVSGGEPIIPATQIQVEIRYSEAEAQSQDSMVAVQFFDEKSSIVETEALLEENILKGLSFETDRLTTTAIVELNETNEEGVLSARYGTLRFVLKYVGDEKLPDDARLVITKKEPTDEEWDSIFRAYSSLKKGLYIQMLEDLKVLDLKIIDSNGETIISNAAEMYLTVKNAKTPGEGRDLSIIYLSDEEQVLINKELTEEKTDEPHISSPLQGICAIVDVYVTDAPDSVAEPAKGD